MAGAAVDQPAGTDRPPTEDASPRLAVSEAPPTPTGVTVCAKPAAAAAAGTASAAAVTVAGFRAAKACPRNTALRMVAMTNQAVVLTAPLIAF